MKISGRSIAYLLILLIAFAVGGFTFVSAQGFITQLPLPVEENGIVEIVRFGTGPVIRVNGGCPTFKTRPSYVVPTGKRLIIEHASAYAENQKLRTYTDPAKIMLRTDDNDGVRNGHLIAFSAEGFPVDGGGPITYYAEAGEEVIFEITCPSRTGINDGIYYRAAFTGRLVPHPHPSTIPTATPPP